MCAGEVRFVVYHRGREVRVTVHQLAGKTMYFATARAMEPLLITSSENDASGFWTSVPGGREKEAEEIGRLITRHIDPGK